MKNGNLLLTFTGFKSPKRMVSDICWVTHSVEELTPHHQPHLPVDSTVGMAERAKALEKNKRAPEFGCATRSSDGALGKLCKCSVSSCVNKLIKSALHSRYGDSLLIAMIISTFIDPHCGPGAVLGGPHHSKNRHSQSQRRKQRLQDGKELPNVPIGACSWLS